MSDEAALQKLIARAGAPPPSSVPRPTAPDFGLQPTDVVRVDTAESEHAREGTRTGVLGALAFAVTGAGAFFLATLIDTDGEFGWRLVVSVAFAVILSEYFNEKIVKWKLSRSAYDKYSIPLETVERVNAFKAADNAWRRLEESRIRSWEATVREKAQLQLESDKQVQRLRESFWRSLSGVEFERQLGKLFESKGYQVLYTKGSGDGGVDLHLVKDSATTIVQCKQHGKPAGVHFVRDLYGTLAHARGGAAILACTGGFSRDAREFARGKPVTLLDMRGIIQLAEEASCK
jgi:HJR/Mrr/RecB family endonuclease